MGKRNYIFTEITLAQVLDHLTEDMISQKSHLPALKASVYTGQVELKRSRQIGVTVHGRTAWSISVDSQGRSRLIPEAYHGSSSSLGQGKSYGEAGEYA